MAGKFLRRGAIIDTIKSEQRTNAIQKREGLKKHPVRVTSCGCPDPNCGCWHTILTDRIIPTDEECKQLLAVDNRSRKNRKSHPKSSTRKK
jgi:hypothetical protein